ncbi:hypothetical protein AB434_4080 [Heyndrickxia coagulans]|nr:hypothetical protein AB434_4080 [Heyndrickxia coagulans]
MRVAIPALKARGFRFVRMDEMFDKHFSIKTSHRRKEIEP